MVRSGSGKRRKGSLSTNLRKEEATWGSPKHREMQDHGVIIVPSKKQGRVTGNSFHLRVVDLDESENRRETEIPTKDVHGEPEELGARKSCMLEVLERGRWKRVRKREAPTAYST